jgi:hypothetical protein
LQPVTVSVVVINTMWMWNDFLLPLLVLSGSKKSLTLQLAAYNFFGLYKVEWNFAMAGVLLTIPPGDSLLLEPSTQHQQGMVAGARKHWERDYENQRRQWNIHKHVRHLPKGDSRRCAHGRGKALHDSATKKIVHRVSTLNTADDTMEITTPLADVLHVRSYHFKGSLKRGPFFELAEDKAELLAVTNTRNGYTALSKDLCAQVASNGPGDVQFFYKGKSLTSSAGLLGGHAIVHDMEPYQVEFPEPGRRGDNFTASANASLLCEERAGGGYLERGRRDQQ